VIASKHFYTQRPIRPAILRTPHMKISKQIIFLLAASAPSSAYRHEPISRDIPCRRDEAIHLGGNIENDP
jgi:hypothetical protein